MFAQKQAYSALTKTTSSSLSMEPIDIALVEWEKAKEKGFDLPCIFRIEEYLKSSEEISHNEEAALRHGCSKGKEFIIVSDELTDSTLLLTEHELRVWLANHPVVDLP